MSDSVGVDAATMTFGGDVESVLRTPGARGLPRRSRRPATSPGGGPQPARRREQIEAITAPHRVRGHQVRLLPAGLDHRPRDGQGRGRGLLPAGRREGLPARLRRDRQPVHRPRRQLHRLRAGGVRAGRDRRPQHVRDAALGSARRARVLRLLRHRDRRAARRRPAPEPQARGRGVRGGARLQLPDRHRARDDVAEARRGRRRPRRASPSPTATTSTSSRNCVRCCSTWSSTGRRSGST